MSIKSQFDAIAKSYDKQRPKFIPCFNDFYGVAIDNLELLVPNPQIIDLGSGTGLFSDFVLQKYPDASITLVDISLFEPEKKYDAVISSLAIHHLEDIAKIKLYNNIYSMLKDDGLFIHAEQVEGETPYLKELNHNRWIETVETSGLSREEIQAGYERAKLDKRASLSKQIGWLKNSGFSEVDCLYKYYDFTVIYCKK